MRTIPIDNPDDPRIADYLNIRDRELAQRDLEQRRQAAGEAPPTEADERRISGGLFIAEGELVVRRLIGSAYRTRSVLLTPTRLAALSGALNGLPPDCPVYLATQQVLNAVIGFNMHRGVLALGERGLVRTAFETSPEAADLRRALIVLEDVWNHDNLGGVYRCAAAFGAAGVLLSPRCADPLYRKSLRVSMGHVLGVPTWRAESWPDAVAQVRRSGRRVLALTPAADAAPIESLADLNRTPVAWLLGSEGPGLSEGAMSLADARVRITIDAGVDSLNVHVAAAIALHRSFDPG